MGETELQQGPEYGHVCDHQPQMDAPGGQGAHRSKGKSPSEKPTAGAVSSHSSDGMRVWDFVCSSMC